VHRSEGMLKPGMLRGRIGKVSEPELLYPAKPLKIGMLDHIEDQGIRNGDESIHRIVDDLLLIRPVQNLLNLLKKYKSAFRAQ